MQCGVEKNLKFRVKPLWPGERYASKAGWGSLKNWCLEQASALKGNDLRLVAASVLNPKLNQAVVRKQVSADKIGAALALSPAGYPRQLVLQIDADIAHHLDDECEENGTLPKPLSVTNRQSACENAVRAWLGGHSGKVGTSIVLCIATMAVETWVLATHDQGMLSAGAGIATVIVDYDYLVSPDTVLVSLGYAANASGGKRVLRKKTGLYAQYGARLVANLEAARTRSSSLNDFCNRIS